MEGYSTSANTDADTSLSVGLQNTKLSAAPTASPEQLSEPEFDGSDHALQREPHLTKGETERVERAVASLLPGPPDTHRVVAVEKRQVLVKSSEVVMVNGKSIELEGQEGQLIKECLISGQLTNYPQLLNQLLVKAGLLLDSTREQTIQTQIQLNSKVTTRESAAVLPCEQNDSSLTIESAPANSVTDGCPASRAQVQQTTETSCIKANREVQWGGSVGSASNILPESIDAVDNICRSSLCDENYVELIKSESKVPNHFYDDVSSIDVRNNHECVRTKMNQNTSTVATENPNLKRMHSRSQDTDAKNNAILSGTLEELIHELVPRARREHCPSEAFQFAFLLGSRLFLTPSRLLTEVERRADQLAHMMSPQSHPSFITNLVAMLQRWMVAFPMDFREESAMRPTKRLARLAVERHPQSESRVNQLLQTLSKHLQAMDKHEKRLLTLNKFNVQIDTPLSFNSLPHPRFQNNLHSHQSNRSTDQLSAADGLGISLPGPLLTFEERGMLNPVSFARELTRIELCEHLYFLGPEELVNNFAKESTSGKKHIENEVSSSECTSNTKSENPSLSSQSSEINEAMYFEARLRAAQKTKNLNAYVEWFNRLSYLVATSICEKTKKKLRVKIIEFWIEVARECINHANFNSLMGIITGLNMTPVRRLKRTWTKLTGKRKDLAGQGFKRGALIGLSLGSGLTNSLTHGSSSNNHNNAGGKFAVLEHQMDPTSNFLSYRSTLKAAVSRSQTTTDQEQRVVIPFFSLLVKDLYFENEGCATLIPTNGHINFEKFNRLGQRLSEFALWKNVECPYEKTSAIADYLQCYPILSEEVLDFMSYECESPDLNEEKDRYKRLKHHFKASSKQISNCDKQDEKIS